MSADIEGGGGLYGLRPLHLGRIYIYSQSVKLMYGVGESNMCTLERTDELTNESMFL